MKGRAKTPEVEDTLIQRLESLERRLATLESPEPTVRPAGVAVPAVGEANRFDLAQMRLRPEEPGETVGEETLARRLGLPRAELRRLREAGYRELVDGDRTAIYLGRKGRGAAHLWSLTEDLAG